MHPASLIEPVHWCLGCVEGHECNRELRSAHVSRKEWPWCTMATQAREVPSLRHTTDRASCHVDTKHAALQGFFFFCRKTTKLPWSAYSMNVVQQAKCDRYHGREPVTVTRNKFDKVVLPAGFIIRSARNAACLARTRRGLQCKKSCADSSH